MSLKKDLRGEDKILKDIICRGLKVVTKKWVLFFYIQHPQGAVSMSSKGTAH